MVVKVLERGKVQYEQNTRSKRRLTQEFQAGDLVLLATKNLNLKIAARKLFVQVCGAV